MTKATNHRKVGKRGYRLHDERIAYSGGINKIITPKYELKESGDKNAGIKDIVFDAVKSDHINLYGLQNFNDFAEAYDFENKVLNEPKNFIEFWILALSLGFGFLPEQNKAIMKGRELLGIKNGGSVFDLLPEKYQALFKREEFEEYWNTKNRFSEVAKVKDYIKTLLNDERANISGILNHEAWNDIEKPKKGTPQPKKANDESFRCKIFEIEKKRLPAKIEGKIQWVWSKELYEQKLYEISDRTKMLDKIYLFWENKTENPIELFGLDTNNNGLSGFFGVFLDGLRADNCEIIEQTKAAYGIGDDSRLSSAVKELRRYLETWELQENPKMTANWEDYRGNFGGKFSSWSSNRLGKQDKAYIDVFNSKPQLEDTKSKLEKDKNKIDDKCEEIIELINDLLEFNADYLAVVKRFVQDKDVKPWSWKEVEKGGVQRITMKSEKKLTREITDKINNDLKIINSTLKKYSDQIKIFNDKGDHFKNPIKTSKIQSSPLFWCESKRKEYIRRLNIQSELKENLCNLSKIYDWAEKQIDGENILTSKQIDNLAKFYQNTKYANKPSNKSKRVEDKNANAKVLGVLDNIQKKLDVKFDDRSVKKRFYINWIDEQHTKYKEKTPNLVDLMKDNQNNVSIKELLKWLDFENLLKEDDLRDIVGLMKNVMGILLSNLPKKVEDYGSINGIYLDEEGNEQLDLSKRQNVEFLSNNVILSNLSGIIAIISKQEFTARYEVQGANRWVQMAKVQGMGKKGQDIERYGYVFGELKGDNLPQLKVNTITTAKDGGFVKDFEACDEKKPAMQINSSGEQIQFMDWLFNKSDKRKTKLNFLGNFLITEQDYKLDWSKQGKGIVCDKSQTELDRILAEKKSEKQKEVKRVYISQPYKLTPPMVDGNGEYVKNVPWKKEYKTIKEEPEQVGCWLGVDVGEYGLDWCVIRADEKDKPTKISVIDQGTIKEKEQRILAEYVKDLRDRQVKQTFMQVDTKQARLRAQLLGMYKNQLEALVMKHKARLVFEDSISSFEVGGKKVMKIYDSVKRGDVRGSISAAEIDNIAAWGGSMVGLSTKPVAGHNYAFEVQANGTSTICTKCGKNARDFDEIKIRGKKVYANCRPDMYDIDLSKWAKEKVGEANWNIVHENNESSTALFICPNPDYKGKPCGHFCDADAQAAFNIAVRGYLKDRAQYDVESQKHPIDTQKNEKEEPVVKNEKRKVEKGLSCEFLTAEQAKLSFNPIGLESGDR